MNCYEILGLPVGASYSEIKVSFVALFEEKLNNIKENINFSNKVAVIEVLRELRVIISAFNYLVIPGKKIEYDALLGLPTKDNEELEFDNEFILKIEKLAVRLNMIQVVEFAFPTDNVSTEIIDTTDLVLNELEKTRI